MNDKYDKWVGQPQKERGTSVVFVHGILSSPEVCWKHTNNTYWPHLLATEPGLPDMGVYVFRYRSDRISGNFDLDNVVDSLKEALKLDGVMKSRRVIFVCHSMGGIVVRKFILVQQSELIKQRIDIGLFLVASPSLGSYYANFLALLTRVLGHRQAVALEFAQRNTWLNDLDKRFMTFKEQGTLLIEGRELVEDTFITFGQSLPKILARLWRKQVVEPFSAARYFGDPFKVPASDHFTIARPENRDAIQHRLLCEFTKEFRSGVGRRRQLRRVVLRVGLSSENPETIGRMLNVCQSIVNVVLQEGEKSLLIDNHLFQYDAAFHNFDRHLDDYDIVMVDCVWLPHFASRLANLSELESFEDFFKERPFEDVFIRSLAEVCKDDKDNVYAIPVSGNVQLLIYRKDLVAKVNKDKSYIFALRNPNELLDFLLSSAQTAAAKPFVVRYATDSDIVDNFWELLRAYGYKEQYGCMRDGQISAGACNKEQERSNQEIYIPEHLANKTLEWLQKAHPNGKVDNCGWREIYPLMDDKKNAGIMMFAWPTWFIAHLMTNPHQNKLVGLLQLSEHPVMGFWSFAIPKKSKYADEAMKVILALTTTPEIQLLMAEAGLVPVLDDIDVGRLKKQNPFWDENYDVIRDALRDARPRPKSKQWRKIEIELAKQIRAGQFKSIDHLFRFTKCHSEQ